MSVKLSNCEDREITFDTFLTTINDWGRFQKSKFVIICLVGMVPVFMFFTWIFIAATPEFRCRLPTEGDDYNFEQNELFDSTSKPSEEDCMTYQNRISLKECQRCYVRVSPRNGTSISNLESCNNYLFDRSIYKKTLVEEWTMVCDRVLYRTIVQITYFLGVMLGAILCGNMSDRYGRRMTMSVCFFIVTIVSFLSTFGPQSRFGSRLSYVIFVLTRFVLACSVRGILESDFVLCSELVVPKKRVMANAVMNYVYVFGMVLLVTFAYFIRSWRMLLLVSSLFVLPFCCFYWLMPESPRWLISKRRYDEAEMILKKAAFVNKTKFDQELYNRFKMTEKVNNDTKKSRTGVSNLFQSKIMTFITVNLFFQWFTQNIVYYGIIQNTASWEFDPYVSFFLGALVELPAYIFFHVILDRVGRKIPYCSFAIAFGILSMLILPVQILFKAEHSAQRIILLVINVLLRFCGALTYAIIYLLTTELFPTDTRTTGLGYCSMIGRVGAIVGTFCNDYLTRISINLPIILYGILSLIAACVALLLPETLNRSLPQTVEEVDHMGLAFGIGSGDTLNANYDRSDEPAAQQLTKNTDGDYEREMDVVVRPDN